MDHLLSLFTGSQWLDLAKDVFHHYLLQLRTCMEMSFGQFVNKFCIVSRKFVGPWIMYLPLWWLMLCSTNSSLNKMVHSRTLKVVPSLIEWTRCKLHQTLWPLLEWPICLSYQMNHFKTFLVYCTQTFRKVRLVGYYITLGEGDRSQKMKGQKWGIILKVCLNAIENQ